jgi:hypothetical protein
MALPTLHYRIAALALACALAACGSDSPAAPPGPAAALQAVHAPSQVPVTTVAADSVKVRVVDAAGTGVPGAQVTWQATGAAALGGATLSAPVALTDTRGYSAVAFTAGSLAGEVHVVAEVVTTAGPAQREFLVTVAPGPAARLDLDPAALTLGLFAEHAFLVVARDAYGNALPAAAVSYSSGSNAVFTVDASGTVSARGAGATTLLVRAGTLQQTVPVTVTPALVQDDFDNENQGGAALSYHHFAGWSVTRGDVDLIGQGSPWDFVPGNGLYVDLDGYYAGGRLETRDAYLLPAGNYRLSFRLAGSQRGDTNTVTVSAGSAFSEAFTVASGQAFVTYTRNFSVTQPTRLRIGFDQAGDDGYGALLDGVSLTAQ